MRSNQSGIEQRIAAQLKQRRLESGFSLADLAERSGVSRAMISKVERSAASPTAVLLGRLCNGLGLTLSSLIANAEESASPLVRAKDQTRWQDPATGLIRTMISPDRLNSPVEIVRIDLPSGARVSYDPQRYLRYEQHIVPIKGRLHLSVGDKEYELGTWDCLLTATNVPLHFHNRGPVSCRYLVIVRKNT
jgi:transcriptional regulator with XRE-family HTH domain